MVFLSLTSQLTKWCLQIGNAQFLPHPFQFIIHSIFPIHVCGTYSQTSVIIVCQVLFKSTGV